MTTKPKANPNYEKSAVNESNQANALCDPEETRTHYELWKRQQEALMKVLEQIEASIPDTLKECRDTLQKTIADTRKVLEESIKVYGGFQDIENGQYALLQGKQSILYNAEKFKAKYPNLAPAVLVDVIKEDVLWALIKADSLNEKELTEAGIISHKKLSPAIIIK